MGVTGGWDALGERERGHLDRIYWGDPGPWSEHTIVTWEGEDQPEGVLGPAVVVRTRTTTSGTADAVTIKLEAIPLLADHLAWWRWWIETGRAQVKRGRKRWDAMPGPPAKSRRERFETHYAPLQPINPPASEAPSGLRQRVMEYLHQHPLPDGQHTITVDGYDVVIEIRTERRDRATETP
jgi:hypothetical protein